MKRQVTDGNFGIIVSGGPAPGINCVIHFSIFDSIYLYCWLLLPLAIKSPPTRTVIISFIKLLPQPDKRQAMIDILKSMEALTRTKTDCRSCNVYEQSNDTHAVLYVEQWQTKDAFERHVQSSMYMRLLTAMELGSEAPEIQFHEVSQTRSMEMIEALRSEGSG